MKERWKDVSGYEGGYMISNLGRVKSLPNVSRSGERVMNPTVSKTGYTQAHLSKCGKASKLLVHRLVADSFITKVDGKHDVNHIDCNRLNNCVTNLEWCTRRENTQHGMKYGNIRHKLTQDDVNCIRYLHGCFSMLELAVIYNLTTSTVHGIINNVKWRDDY